MKTADSAESAADTPAASSKGSGPLAGLNKGDMAAFVIKKEPEPLPPMPMEGADGKEVAMADFKGKVVLLNIWATWCHPCREEMPALDKLQKELGGEDFEVVAMNIDRGSPDKAKDFLKEVKAENLAFYRDPSSKLFTKLKAVGMPTTLLVNRDGEEMGRLVGPAEWDSPEAVRLIKAAIAANGDAADPGDAPETQ
ncbi:TlpA disulfide reductase family protein [Methyloligella solikamskensis]|uniref:TlpA disulfide reductase family protein n=1 Tax=Methyloligella solikamskensis TaxID=1177756 RepID=A0ABW3J706_9HYPH